MSTSATARPASIISGWPTRVRSDEKPAEAGSTRTTSVVTPRRAAFGLGEVASTIAGQMADTTARA